MVSGYLARPSQSTGPARLCAHSARPGLHRTGGGMAAAAPGSVAVLIRQGTARAATRRHRDPGGERADPWTRVRLSPGDGYGGCGRRAAAGRGCAGVGADAALRRRSQPVPRGARAVRDPWPAGRAGFPDARERPPAIAQSRPALLRRAARAANTVQTLPLRGRVVWPGELLAQPADPGRHALAGALDRHHACDTGRRAALRGTQRRAGGAGIHGRRGHDRTASADYELRSAGHRRWQRQVPVECGRRHRMDDDLAGTGLRVGCRPDADRNGCTGPPQPMRMRHVDRFPAMSPAMVRARCFRTTRHVPLTTLVSPPRTPPAGGFSRPPLVGAGWRLRDDERAGRARHNRGILGRARIRGARIHPRRALRALHPRGTGTDSSAARPAFADHRRVDARGCPRHGRRRATACAQAQRLRLVPDGARGGRAVRTAAAGGAPAPRPHDPARSAAHPCWSGLGTARG
ncbi:hypothetical protein CCACVL1_02306 [Corchorus capsularis]|uniref:Uncharacterized protein n=1 Tax=Corchorus capsularis TaxID=210143 RepID=A0A1R3K9F8_COCAP|nr:hypothetical protein CCACVL1_02306 [Corchorus capsularis]